MTTMKKYSKSKRKQTKYRFIEKSRKYRQKSSLNKTRKSWKHMMCSPNVSSIKVETSCYTPHILNTIKDAYNKSNPSDQITTSNPTEIWNELHAKLDHCNKEDCWLNSIDDPKLQKHIDRYVFAPDKPPEWNADPNAWLSNYDIMNVLEQYEKAYPHFNFIGPTPIDFDAKLNTSSNQCVWNELCHFDLDMQMKKGYSQFGIIFNTDNSGGPGKHWISLYIDISNQVMFYFDSANATTPPEVDVLAQRILDQAKKKGIVLKYMRNDKRHQQSDTECGMYSLFFIVTMLTGKIEGRRIGLRKRLNMFKGEKKIPDSYIEAYRNIYFND